jgi:hypothetical protein
MGNSVSTSTRIYGWLLRLYPSRFRLEYGNEMATVFRDLCHDEYQHNGALGVIGVWAETVPDLVVSVSDEHAQEDFQMAKTNLIRVLAIAGIVGGALWIAFGVLANMRPAGVPGGAYRATDDLLTLFFLGALGLAAGLLGVYLHSAGRWATPPRLTLLVSLAGVAWSFATTVIFKTNFYVWVGGWFTFMLGALFTGLLLIANPTARQWAALFITLAVTTFLFNFEDWRVLFGVVAGIVVIVISALTLSSSLNRQSGPPIATA